MEKSSIKKLPLASILIAVFLAVGLLLFIGFYSKKGALSQINIFGVRETVIESQNKDTDNDGLRDWEEELLKTDPLNPDTDMDGYLDGEEINSGHNPLVKSPGDKQVFYPLPLGDRYNITKRVLDEELIDSILDSYISQKNEYLADHPELSSVDDFSSSVKQSTLQEMSQRALDDSYLILIEKAEQTLLEIPEIFEISITDEDIRISENNSIESIKLYLSQASSILNSDTFFLQDQSFQSLKSAFENNDFAKLDGLISSNDVKIRKAKEIIVPSSWKEIHKEGLGLTLLIRNIYVSFRDTLNDPIKVYIALQEFEDFSSTWNDLMKKAINLANEQSVDFSL